MGIMLSTRMIEEIAESLQNGNNCALHKKTHKILHFPKDWEDYCYDQVIYDWVETIFEYQKNLEDYYFIDHMDASDYFIIMQEFTKTIEDKEAREELVVAMSNRLPYSTFQKVMENSPVKKDWEAFRHKRFITWVYTYLGKME